MWPNPQLPVDLDTFTEEILNGDIFLSSVDCTKMKKHLRHQPLKLLFALFHFTVEAFLQLLSHFLYGDCHWMLCCVYLCIFLITKSRKIFYEPLSRKITWQVLLSFSKEIVTKIKRISTKSKKMQLIFWHKILESNCFTDVAFPLLLFA